MRPGRQSSHPELGQGFAVSDLAVGLGVTLCYAIVLLGQKPGFLLGFRPDFCRESLQIGRPAGPRPAGGPI